jgi:hypothetical protein
MFQVLTKNLTFARSVPRPSFIPHERAQKGVKGLGLRYERKVRDEAQELYGSDCKGGIWFEYYNGQSHWCQVDVLIYEDLRKVNFILECKLTDVEEAKEKLRDLYIPVVRAATNLPTFGIVVAKNLTPKSDKVVATSLYDATDMAVESRKVVTLHYIGKGKI